MGKRTFIRIWAVLVLLTAAPALAGMDLPEGLKQAISPYPGSRVIQTMSMKNSTMASIEVSDRPESVLAFYKKELTEKGWDISTDEGQGSLFARKGASALVMDTSTDNYGKTHVNLTLTGP